MFDSPADFAERIGDVASERGTDALVEAVNEAVGRGWVPPVSMRGYETDAAEQRGPEEVHIGWRVGDREVVTSSVVGWDGRGQATVDGLGHGIDGFDPDATAATVSALHDEAIIEEYVRAERARRDDVQPALVADWNNALVQHPPDAPDL